MLPQSSKMGAQVRQKLAPLLLAGAFFVCLVSGSDQSASTTALAKRIPPLRGAVKVGGWTQVNERWPVHPEADYFFAVDKGHHFIQVKLPARLQSDLIVTLKYYYAYAKVRPFFQIVPCKTNVDILSDKLEENSPDQGSWHVHQMRVKRADCEKRKELAYNVLLHDANDFFAWSSLEIKSADESQNNPTSRPTTAKPAAGKTTAKPIEDAGKTDQPIESDLFDTIKIAAPESPTTPKTSTEESLPLNDASKPSSGETTQVPTSENSDKINEDSQKDKVTEDNSQGEPEKVDLPSEPSELGRSEPLQFQNEPNHGNYPEPADESESEKLEIPPESSAESDSFKGNDKGPSETMGKREAEWDKGDVSREKRAAASPTRFDLTCKPSMCNRNMVNYPRFMKLIGSSAISNGPYSPASAASRSLVYLNTKNQPLGVQIESDDHDFAELNLCLDMNLYMDAGTKLSLMLGNDGSANGQKLLEIIERKSGDSAAGKWERVKRCLSDYMPRLRKPAVQGDDQADTAKSGLKRAPTKHEEIHKVNLSFVPQSQWPDKQKILVNLMRDSMVTLKEAPAILQYLPNVVGEDNSVEAAKRMWTLDQDGIEKAEFKSSGTPESLRVEQIDPTQEYFDLTSRWIKLDEPEVLDNSVLFHYKTDKAAWIKALDFEFQNVDQAANVWRTERVYSRAEVVPPTTPASKIEAGDSKVHYVQRTDGSTLESSGLRRAEDEAAASGILATPIRLRGLNAKEFRIRLRHHVDKSLAAAGAHQLNIRKLAFGDACALDQPYCLNGGACRPTGISKAKCTCRRGYSGKHCEVARPCDALHAANMTGYELCHSIGARCVEQIPVFKCIWPDDRYYQCKALEAPATHPAGQQGGGASGAEPSPVPQSATERLGELEANAAQQQQLIIVMAVFMASLMLFAIVIVINMIMKLRKSNRRLKTAQIEVYELNRQNTPGTSSSAAMSASAPSFGRAMGARNKQAAPATITYNNRAFDATGQ